MSKTPTKSPESLHYSTAKDLISPIKDSTGLAKTVYSHVSNVHNLLNKWVKVNDIGTKIVKTISALKLHEFKDDYYPKQLAPLTEELLEVMDALKDVVDGIEIVNSQLQVLAKLQPSESPIINTWSVSYISSQVFNFCSTLAKELRLKQIITENIAHCRDEKLIETYASAWEYTVYINWPLSAYLFAEVGLNSIMQDTK